MSGVLVASPPRAAVGGVAAHTEALVEAMPEVRAFDQWWPLRSRSPRPQIRAGVHALGLARWVWNLTARRPDVAHLQVTSPGIPRDLMYLRIAQRLRVPVVAHLHTSGFFGPGTAPSTREKFAAVVLAADAVVVMSSKAAEELGAELPETKPKVRVVPNPAVVDTALYEDDHDLGGTCRLLCVGEINALKGQLEVADAVSDLAADGLDIELTLVGPRGAISEGDWVRLQENRHVHLVGVRRGEELLRSYAASDVFVLFSRTEAEPMAMLESMAMGLPVVMTAVGSIPETLSQAGAGNALLDPTDRDGLRSALRRLVLDADLRREVGRRNCAWARENRSMAQHAEALRTVHRQAAHPRTFH